LDVSFFLAFANQLLIFYDSKRLVEYRSKGAEPVEERVEELKEADSPGTPERKESLTPA